MVYAMKIEIEQAWQTIKGVLRMINRCEMVISWEYADG